MGRQTHRFDPTAIREYDIRGVVGKTLFPDDAYAVGRGFATILREDNQPRQHDGVGGERAAKRKSLVGHTPTIARGTLP